MIHFISGLPRSGSTLLVALLRQNPRFHAEMSSPVGHIFSALQRAVSAQNEASCFISDRQRQRLLGGVFENFYGSYFDQNIMVFDTGRQWCAKLPLIAHLFLSAKIICCVRDPAWTLDSIERLVRANPLQLSGIFGYESGGTVYTRCEALMAPGGMVGHALNAFREAFYSDLAKRLFVLDYDALAKCPREAMGILYEFLGEPLFEHDFEGVSYDATEFDARLGTPGLHTVRGPVAWRERVPCLPPALFKKYTDTFWRDPAENIGDAMVIT